MKELVFFLEEESAKALLEKLVPRLVPDGAVVAARFVVFDGKQDLHRNLERKLRGYLRQGAHFIVLRDQDRDDCSILKKKLLSICTRAGRRNTVIRIACRELESFYLGDLNAVELALGVVGLSRKQRSAKFRDPDRLQNPAAELEKLTGFYYQKVAGSRAIGEHLSLDDSRSKSYLHLVRSIMAAIHSK
jgi:hypothetical protein